MTAHRGDAGSENLAFGIIWQCQMIQNQHIRIKTRQDQGTTNERSAQRTTHKGQRGKGVGGGIENVAMWACHASKCSKGEGKQTKKKVLKSDIESWNPIKHGETGTGAIKPEDAVGIKSKSKGISIVDPQTSQPASDRRPILGPPSPPTLKLLHCCVVSCVCAPSGLHPVSACRRLPLSARPPSSLRRPPCALALVVNALISSSPHLLISRLLISSFSSHVSSHPPQRSGSRRIGSILLQVVYPGGNQSSLTSARIPFASALFACPASLCSSSPSFHASLLLRRQALHHFPHHASPSPFSSPSFSSSSPSLSLLPTHPLSLSVSQSLSPPSVSPLLSILVYRP